MKSCNILIVDDTEENIDVLSELLGDDYEVSVATDGETALQAVYDNHPDLILLDIMMPGMDGYEVCKKLKTNPATQDIPIIFVTAMSEVNDETKGLELGAIDYITKPISPSIVKARIKNHLELKLVREELKKQNEILKENLRLREDMEQVSRHDLKTPLNAVISIPKILIKGGDLSSNQKEMLLMLEESGYRMLEIVNSSLDLLKMEKGNYQFNPVPVDILNLIQQIRGETLELFNRKELILDIIINGNQFDNTQNFMVSGEEMLCYSMLANLIKNAIEASPEKEKIEITLNDGERQEIKIHNKGPVPEQIKEKFFDKYATFGKKDGTGLGTYSAKLIIQTLKGEIRLESSLSSGTTLIIYLLPVSLIPNNKTTNLVQGDKLNSLDISKNVLVADDYKSMRRIIVSLLMQMGFLNFVEVSDGLQALEKIESEHIDLIISDCKMPIKTGLDILKYVRSKDKFKHIPFIMVTGESDRDMVMQAAKMGVTAFVVKPFSPDLLRKKIELLLTSSL
ncbi:MAG: response regulator [Desulfobacterales bacterium]|nr:response regulator [Desulfobacterales bacterium]MBF0396202.1 response regulator [Desulfobacterales bacterium]